MRKTIRVVVAVGAATAIAIVGAASALAGTKIEHLSFVTTSATGAYSASVTGPFTDGGIAILQDNQGTPRLQKGAIKVTMKPGRTSQSVNPKTSLGVATQPGTYKLVSGTGAYKGITGSGKYVAHFAEVGRIVNGKCSRTARAVAVQGAITASGPVTLH